MRDDDDILDEKRPLNVPLNKTMLYQQISELNHVLVQPNEKVGEICRS